MTASTERTETALAETSASDLDSKAAPEVVHGERYMLLDRIGEGGMGVVWAAYDRRLDRKVALKLLNDRFLGAANQARLASEARAMAKLAHPNVVPVFDVGEREGRAFLTMEFVKGRSLSEWLRTRRTWQEIVAVFRDAARGLAAAHGAGLIHRDVKPGNILLGDDGRTRVADFGVSRADTVDTAAAPSGAITSETTGLVGSPAYMAPEQLRTRRVDARCDQFGLCVALYEALAGTRPFHAATFEELLAAIDKEPPPIEGDVPDWLRRVVNRGLAADPAARFPSMTALADALAGPAPSHLRRNLVLGAVVAGAVAVAVIAAVQLRATPAAGLAPPDCAAEATQAAEASWNPARRAALIAAITGTGVPGAAQQGERIAGAIDQHVAAWRGRWETTCRASQVEHTWPEDLGVLSRSCLEEQRTTFTALFDALTRADAAAVDGGYALVTRLEPPSPCGDPDLLRGQIAPPRDPARAAEIAALVNRGAALNTALTLRRDAEVERDLPGFVADVERSGDTRLQAKALQIGAMRARLKGDLASATTDMKKAYLLSRRDRDVAQAAYAAADLVWLLGYFQGDAAAGEDWANLALVELDSIPNNRYAIQVHQAIGVFAESRGQGPRSIEHQQRALELTRRYFGPDHFMTAKAIELVASALGEAGKPAEAAALYRESRPLIAKTFGDPSLAYAHLLSHYAIVLKNAGDDATADQIAVQSLEVGRAAGAEGPDLGSLLLNRGAVLQEAGRFEEAIGELRAARDAYLAASMPAQAAMALTNLGRIEADLLVAGGDSGLERRAIADLEEAARVFEKELGPTDRDLALTLTSLGFLHGARGRCPRAIPLAERAVTIYEATPDLPDIADPLLVIGRCRLDAGRVADAVSLIERASKVQHAGGNDPVIAAELDAWLGIALVRAGDRTRAAPLLTAARAVLAGQSRFAQLVARIDREVDGGHGD